MIFHFERQNGYFSLISLTCRITLTILGGVAPGIPCNLFPTSFTIVDRNFTINCISLIISENRNGNLRRPRVTIDTIFDQRPLV